jgi:hypothetical protein
MTELPYRTVKRILKENVNGEVTHQSVVCVKSFLDNLCKDIAKASLKEFEKYNELRRFHNLPKVKRIPSSIYKNVLSVLYKEISDVINDDVGNAQEVNTTLSTDANEWWYYA